MAVVVHQLEHSPYCIPITAALRALGVRFRTVQVSYGDRTPIFRLTQGRYHQVPVLVDGKTVVYESAADTLDVARHVDRRWGGGRLFPAEHEGVQRVVVAHLENEVEGTTFRLVDPKFSDTVTDDRERMFFVRFKERKFGRGCLEAWRRQAPELRAQAEALLTPYDLMLQTHPFLFGAAPAYADFALYGIVGNLTYRGINRLPARLKALRAWVPRIEAFRYES
ncbi:MAG TPA: glutathione S-transferase family protein [Opitutaceae bacterium]|nr:glutathione S-transferase family protein [Opitutaceae bacterium]